MRVDFSLPPAVEAIQALLVLCPDDDCRKQMLITAHCCGALTKDETTLLFQAWGFEQ